MKQKDIKVGHTYIVKYRLKELVAHVNTRMYHLGVTRFRVTILETGEKVNLSPGSILKETQAKEKI